MNNHGRKLSIGIRVITSCGKDISVQACDTLLIPNVTSTFGDDLRNGIKTLLAGPEFVFDFEKVRQRLGNDIQPVHW